MSLRVLGSLLTRRFSSRGIPRAQAQAESSLGTGTQAARRSAAGKSARSLYSLRDLAVGDGPHGAVVAAAALAGTFAILYFKKDTASKVIGEEARNEVTDKKPVNEVHDVVISEACDGKARQEVTDSESLKKQDKKARFEDWAKKYKKTYKDEEERAMRFQVFKANAEFIDQNRLPLGTNYFADWTREEFRRLRAFPNGGLSEDQARELAELTKTLPRVSKEFQERRAQSRHEAGNLKPHTGN